MKVLYFRHLRRDRIALCHSVAMPSAGEGSAFSPFAALANFIAYPYTRWINVIHYNIIIIFSAFVALVNFIAHQYPRWMKIMSYSSPCSVSEFHRASMPCVGEGRRWRIPSLVASLSELHRASIHLVDEGYASPPLASAIFYRVSTPSADEGHIFRPLVCQRIVSRIDTSGG